MSNVYIRSCNKMVTFGYVYTLGKHFAFPRTLYYQNVEFHTSPYMIGIRKCHVSSTRSTQKFGGKKKKKNMKDETLSLIHI